MPRITPKSARVALLAGLAWGGLLALSGCQSSPLARAPAMPTVASASVTPWLERRVILQAITHYEFKGQLAIAAAGAGFSGALRWQQSALTSDVLLRAPLGIGGAHLSFDGVRLQVTGGDGVLHSGALAESEVRQLLGFDPPLGSLHYWLLGAPDPAAPLGIETLDSAQRLAQLQQGAWQIDYSDYEWIASAVEGLGPPTTTLAGGTAAGKALPGGLWLPKRMSLRHGEVKLKLHVSQWRWP